MEKMVQIPVGGLAAVGTLTLPPGSGRPGVLMLHGLKSSRASRKYVRVARRLAAQGIASLRIDFRGSGESEGEFHDASVRTAFEDARAALDALARVRSVSSRRLGVVAGSYGGVVAARCLAADRRIKAGVLISTPARFARMIADRTARPLVAESIAESGYYGEGAFRFGPDFIRDARDVDTVADVRRTRAALLFIQGDADRTVPPEHARALLEAAGRRRARGMVHELVMIPGSDHGFDTFTAEREVARLTAEWLARFLAPPSG